MEAVIRVSALEFDEKLFAKIKSLLKNSKESEVIIKITNRSAENILQEPEAEYWTKINRSIKEIEEGKGTVFTMKEFEEYIGKNFPE
jgi:hypothetical protein